MTWSLFIIIPIKRLKEIMYYFKWFYDRVMEFKELKISQGTYKEKININLTSNLIK